VAKKAFNIQIKLADGGVIGRCVLAQDAVAGMPAVVSQPAIMVAIQAVLKASAAGAEVLAVNVSGTVDIDATAA
jgi:hypothetical protein